VVLSYGPIISQVSYDVPRVFYESCHDALVRVTVSSDDISHTKQNNLCFMPIQQLHAVYNSSNGVLKEIRALCCGNIVSTWPGYNTWRSSIIIKQMLPKTG